MPSVPPPPSSRPAGPDAPLPAAGALGGGPVPSRPELPAGVTGAPLPPGDPRAASPLAAVPVWAPFVAMILVFGAALLAGGVMYGIAAAGGADISADAAPPGVVIPATFAQDALFLLGAYFGARLWSQGRLRPSVFGFRTAPLLPAIGWTLLAYVAFFVFAAVYSVIIGDPPEQDLVRELRDEDSLVVLAGYALMVAIGAPLVEEAFFRGYMFGVLREQMPLVAAVLIGGTVFALIHIIGTPVRTLPILIALGVLFCLLYWKTGSLLPGMSLHAINNSIAFASTKSLSVGEGAVAVVTSVALVLAIANAVIAWERRLP